jgi:hypothetical protein
MATQVRCAKCGHVSAARDMRTDTADKFTKAHLGLLIAAVVFVVWAVVELLRR